MAEMQSSRETSASSKHSSARIVSFSPVVADEERPLRVHDPEDHDSQGQRSRSAQEADRSIRDEEKEAVASMYATVGGGGKSPDDDRPRGGASAAGGSDEDSDSRSPSLPPPRKFSDGKVERTDEPDGEGISRQDRDPHNVNGDIQVSFADIFAEPQGLHSEDDVWVCTYKTYKGSKYWCYRICTLICAVPAACLWGITFACLAFSHIWCVVPFVKAFLIQLKCFGKIFTIWIHVCCDPLYKSAALMFSRIRVNFARAETTEQNFYSKYDQGLY